MKPVVAPATITSSIAVIFLLALAALVLGGYYAAETVRDHSVERIAEDEARRNAEMAFESMYLLMRRGWSRQDMLDAQASLSRMLPDVTLRVIRSEKLARQYGEVNDSAAYRQEPLVAEVLASGREMSDRRDDSVRYVFPVIFREYCVTCHTGVRPGEVNGVVDVTLPTRRLKAPLDVTITWTLGIFGLVMLCLLAAMYVALRLLIVRPIACLSGHIDTLIHSKELKPLEGGGFWSPTEIRHLTGSFNRLTVELEEARRELRRLAGTDPLTGLMNRLRLAEVITIEGERSRRYGRPLTLIVIDLNDFKPVNDRWGHEAGDRMLVHVAQLVKEHTRKSDFACRLGGDEFVILAPDTSDTQARSLVQNLRLAFAEARVTVADGVSLPVSASFGCASWPEDGTWPEDLFTLADERMYADKQAGKAARHDAPPLPGDHA